MGIWGATASRVATVATAVMAGAAMVIAPVATSAGPMAQGGGASSSSSSSSSSAARTNTSASTNTSNSTSTSTSEPAPTPVVSGNRILDSRDGSTFVPRGANWPSFEYACIATSGRGWAYSQDDDTQAAADAMKSWHINIVRIPLNQDCWLGNNPSHLFGSAAGYQAAVRHWVDMLNGDGIVAMLDLHWNAPVGKIAADQFAMPDAQSITFWSQVASSYKSDASVIFDLFNEPYSRWNPATSSWAFQLSWDCWENGGCHAPAVSQGDALDGTTYTVFGMSALVAAVRTAGAAQPIMLGGIDYSNDLTGWLAHKPDDGQLIASWHNYPGQACDTLTCWNNEIAPVATSVPVIAGETGETDGASTFLQSFMTWADSHGIGYLPWAWWEVDASESHDNSLYALVTGPNFTPKAPAGTAFHDHLAALAATRPPVGTTPGAMALNVGAPGFEGSIAGWKPHSNGIRLALGTAAGTAHSGTGYLTATATTAGRAVDRVIALSGGKAGDFFTATVWLRTQGTATVPVSFSLIADGGASESSTATVTLDPSWQKYSIGLRVRRAGHGDIRLSIAPKLAGRTIFVDDASASRVPFHAPLARAVPR